MLSRGTSRLQKIECRAQSRTRSNKPEQSLPVRCFEAAPMPTIHIIAQSHPELARRLQSLNDTEAERLLRWVVPRVPEHLCKHPLVVAYRSHCLAGGPLKTGDSGALEAAADELDERYFELEANGAPEATWTPFFEQAKVAAAFSEMAKDPSASNLPEVTYEMAHAHDPPDTFFDLVERELEKAGE